MRFMLVNIYNAFFQALGMVLGGIVLGASSMVFSLRRTKKALRFSTVRVTRRKRALASDCQITINC